jgi:SNF2 family DNA or RNA helicase
VNPLVDKYGSKLGKLISMIRNIVLEPSSRIIIFSQWDYMLKLIGKSLTDNGIRNGNVKGNAHCRKNVINNFKNGKTLSGDENKVIILSLKNSASGSNLSEATHIFFVEPINSTIEEIRAIEGQAIARACRIGQQQKIKLFRLLVKDTIEEDIYNKFYVIWQAQ